MTRTPRATLATVEILLELSGLKLAPAKRAAHLARLQRVYEIITSAVPAEAEAWIRMGERIAAGVPFEEAEADFRAEMARLREAARA